MAENWKLQIVRQTLDGNLQWLALLGASLIRARARTRLYKGQFDLVLIDAGHGYECALSDSRSALGLIEGRDGMTIWHDYAAWPGVTRAVEEVRAANADNAEFFWIAGTTLTAMRAKPGRKLAIPAKAVS